MLVLFKRELTRKVHSDSCSFLHAKAEPVGYDGGGGGDIGVDPSSGVQVKQQQLPKRVCQLDFPSLSNFVLP